MPLLLIDDGFNDFTGTIPAFGRWPAVTLKYRPCLPAASKDYAFRVGRCNTGAEVVAVQAEFLAEYVKGWDVTDVAGQALPVSKENLARVPDRILTEMLNIVTGYSDRELVADSKK